MGERIAVVKRKQLLSYLLNQSRQILLPPYNLIKALIELESLLNKSMEVLNKPLLISTIEI